MSERAAVSLRLNGKKREVEVPPMKRLLDVLREDLGLTGTKEGCGEGECGACSVLIDGEVANSCLIPVCQVEGAEVITIEGIGRKKLHPLQKAFLECGGAQCGICTPGMIVAASALPAKPTLDQVKEGLAGNLCRCTGYTKIYDSVLVALGSRKATKEAPAATATAGSNEKAAKKKKKKDKANKAGKAQLSKTVVAPNKATKKASRPSAKAAKKKVVTAKKKPSKAKETVAALKKQKSSKAPQKPAKAKKKIARKKRGGGK